MTTLLEALVGHRAPAGQLARAYLAARGFTESDDCWVGEVDVGLDEPAELRVSLPVGFPDDLPQVRIDPARLPRRLPHVESDGKVCIASSTNLLLDVGNPEGIVEQAIDRACEILSKGLTGANAGDFLVEYLAYWPPAGGSRALSIVSPLDQSRRISLLTCPRAALPSGRSELFANDVTEAGDWLGRLGLSSVSNEPAFLVSLDTPFDPPEFGRELTFGELLALIRANASESAREKMREFLESTRLPVRLLLSMPVSPEERTLVGVQFGPPSGNRGKAARAGMRPGRASARLLIERASLERTSSIRIERFDSAFLLGRTGAKSLSLERHATVVGCGAVGSSLAFHLAAAGVGHLTLIDSETFENSNIHRHFVGAAAVGLKKVEAVKAELGRRFPGQRVEAIGEDFITAAKTREDAILNSDVVVFATGNHTFERLASKALSNRVPTASCWVEPLGVAGHALLRGDPHAPGCLDCIYEPDDELGLVNLAAIVAPGQDLDVQFAGCSGAFTPFSELNSDKAALGAATAIVEHLTGADTSNRLVTWRGLKLPEGVRLSQRSRRVEQGAVRVERNFFRRSCKVCGLG